MRATALDAESLYRTLRDGPSAARRALLDSLPDSGFGVPTASLLDSDKPGMVILAFVPVVVKLCAGVDPGVGTPLAFATHRHAVELFEENTDHAGLLPMTLSNLASQYANGCNLLGDFAATLSFTDTWIPYYERLGEPQNLPSLKAARINALINIHRLDDAQNALDDPNLRGNWATDIEIARLEKRLRQLRGDITEDKGKAAARQAAGASEGVLTNEVKNALHGMLNQAIDDPQQKQLLQDLLGKRLETSRPTDPNTPAGFDALSALLRQGEAFLTNSRAIGNQMEDLRRQGEEAVSRLRGTDSELTIRRRVREAAGIFVGGRTPSAEQIRAALADLERCLAWAREHDHTELMRDAWWGMYLCHGRLDEPSEAADALLELRGSLERDRAGITDPLKRGGVFSLYPHLFSALCEKLQKAGRTEQLLEAIEASKGRGVADILTRAASRPVEDASIYSAVARLPELTREHSFHYVTFHVDDEQTYIALVSKSGDIHAIPPVPLGRGAIREAAQHVDPREGNTADALAPLVEWIDAFVEKGIIALGDHIAYAPDEDLSNIPLQYLSCRGGTLIDLVSLSRIHSAFHLEHLLSASGRRPTAFLAFVVPTQQNVARKSWRKLQGFLRAPAVSLQERLEGEIVEDRAATLDCLAVSEVRNKVLHFSAHGMFPPQEMDGTPFEDSGVVMAPRDGLPDADALARGEIGGVLTPRRVLDFKLDLSGSHVSFMACVSGLSREGLGGDALGIEWAFTQAGAASLLASHWDVNAEMAAAFVRSFYDKWLGERMPRAHALVETVTEFRKRGGRFAEPESWAAFSLTGDWR